VTPDAEFTSFVAARWGALVGSAMLLGCTRPDAEDAAQTALVSCYQSWERVRRADRPEAYVYKVLMNTLARSRRRRWHGERPTAELPVSCVPDVSATSDTRADLARVLSRLTAQHREVLVLRFVADLTEHEVAELLGVAVGTVKSRTSRALAAVDAAALREETP
jgi:RNA polymerase sigma-70 factor (sigma-E family)